MAEQYVGRGVRRREDLRLVTGRGRYSDDAAPVGSRHVAFVRSPYAHARIRSVDTSAARTARGVVDVITAADLDALDASALVVALPGGAAPVKPLLARDKVLYQGDPVAAVLAVDRAAAVDAAAEVRVEYEPLPTVSSPRRALEEGATLIHEGAEDNRAFRLVRGGEGVDEALKAADAVARIRIWGRRVAAVPLEPRAIVASYDPSVDGLEVWMGSQMPHGVRSSLARLLRLGEHRVRVLMQDMGGAFGARSGLYAEEVLTAFFAWKHRATATWTETRSESLQTMAHGRAISGEVALGITRDGRMTVVDVQAVADVGAFAHPIAAGPANNLSTLATGVYRIPHARAAITGVYTNRTPVAPYRGAGRPEAVLALERAVEEAARLIQMDPAELRRRNFLGPDVFPYTTPIGAVYDSGNYAPAFEKALSLIEYERWRAEQRAGWEHGRMLGIGICSFVEPAGALAWESGAIRVDASGNVTLLTGAAPHGQGHQTTLAQVVADELGVPMEAVAVRYGDTAAIPIGGGTFGSRSASLAGSAALLAARKVKDQMRQVAANLLEVQADDVELADRRFQVVGAPGRALGFGEVAAAAHQGRGLAPGQPRGLEAAETFTMNGMSFPFGTHVAVIEVSPETGEVQVLRYVGVDDCGTVINPLLVEGQMQGGLAQGFGEAFLEELVYDDEGQLLTASLMDYALPRARDVMTPTLSHTVTPSPLNPLGAKGVGEAGAIGAPSALLNAVLDAVAPFGVRDLSMPLTASKIWAALQNARASAAASA